MKFITTNQILIQIIEQSVHDDFISIYDNKRMSYESFTCLPFFERWH